MQGFLQPLRTEKYLSVHLFHYIGSSFYIFPWKSQDHLYKEVRSSIGCSGLKTDKKPMIETLTIFGACKRHRNSVNRMLMFLI